MHSPYHCFSEHRLLPFQDGQAGSINNRERSGSINNRESLDRQTKTARELESLQKDIEGGALYRKTFQSWIEERLGQSLPAEHRFDVRCEEDFRGENLVGNLRVTLLYSVGNQMQQSFDFHPTNPEARGVVIDNEDMNFPYRAVQREGRTLLIFTQAGFLEALNTEAGRDSAVRNWLDDIRLAIQVADKASAGGRSEGSRGARGGRSEGSRGRRSGEGPGSIPDRSGRRRSRGSRGSR